MFACVEKICKSNDNENETNAQKIETRAFLRYILYTNTTITTT